MPNFSGIWTVTQQMQAKGASTWPATPGAPTIGTATAGIAACASVTFTAPGCTGYPAGVTGYRVVSTPGCFTNTGASSPIVVTGLSAGTSYTFKAQATNATGYGALSAASNSITANIQTCATYTTAGSYSWVAPSGVTSVAVVAVGGGGGGTRGGGGGGGELRYGNAISVTPGNSYAVVVGARGTSAVGLFCASNGGNSTFNTSTVVANGGKGYNFCISTTPGGSGGTGTGGGNGGSARTGGAGGGGGAGGYAGTGGFGGYCGSQTAGSGGAGGGGANANSSNSGGGGGGVGLYGQGSNGAAGTGCGGGGGGSSGGAGGSGSAYPSNGGAGGAYGGGGGHGANGACQSAGGLSSPGAVRIVWAGGSRGTPSFPSTCVGP